MLEIIGINISFAIPVELSNEHNLALSHLVQQIAKDNEPEGMVHWLCSTGFGKMKMSGIDARLLGTTPGRVMDESIKDGEEPQFENDEVLYLETHCREDYKERG